MPLKTKEEINAMTVGEYGKNYPQYSAAYVQVVGRPSKYTLKTTIDLLEFVKEFDEAFEDVAEDIPIKSGVIHKTVRKGKKLPTVEGYCRRYNIQVSKYYEYVKNVPEFREAHALLKAAQKENLIQGALLGVYNQRFAEFVAINNTDMRSQKINIDVNIQPSESFIKFLESKRPEVIHDITSSKEDNEEDVA